MAELNAFESRRTKNGEVALYRPQDNVSLTVSGGAAPSHESDPIRIEDADSLALTVQNGASTSLDAMVLSSFDGSTFDTEPYASLNLGANRRKSIPITVGVRFIKVRVENRDTANATTVTTIVTKYIHD